MTLVMLAFQVRELSEEESKFPVYKKYLIERFKQREKKKEEKLSRENWPVRRLR